MFVQLLLVALSAFQADAANVYKQTFTFSDQTQFADLSVYNFDKGLTYTYQYSITARPNRQTTIYFFTNLLQNANVALYNGADATAPRVDISALYKIMTDGTEIRPVALTSTGRSFYMEVTPLTTNAAMKQDFQAVATDIIQPAACGPLFYLTGLVRYFPQVPLPVAPVGCIHIIRTVDLSNNKNAYLSVSWLDTDATTSVYKGLSMSPATKLVTLAKEFSFNEKNIIIQHKRPMTINYGYVYDLDNPNSVFSTAMNSKQTNMFISGDYYPPRPVGATETTKNTYMFTPMFKVDSLKINFLSGIGTGNLLLTYMNFQQANKTVTYTKANLPKSLTIKDTDQLLLSYSCTGTACTGMYGTVEDATIQ